MEETKNTKDDNKEKETPELKEELTEDELKGVDGGGAFVNEEMIRMGLLP